MSYSVFCNINSFTVSLVGTEIHLNYTASGTIAGQVQKFVSQTDHFAQPVHNENFQLRACWTARLKKRNSIINFRFER